MSFGGGAPAPDTYARDIFSRIQKEQRATYDSVYKPLETSLVARFKDPQYINNMENKASRYSQAAATNSAGIAARTRSRYGTVPTLRQNAAISRSTALSNAEANVNAINTTRTGAYGLQTAGLSALSGMGNRHASSALGTAGAMTNLESQRNANNQKIAAADQAGTGQFIGTALGIGAAFATGGASLALTGGAMAAASQ